MSFLPIDGLVPVVERDTDELLFWAYPSIVGRLIESGNVRRIGSKRRARKLIWIGEPRQAVTDEFEFRVKRDIVRGWSRCHDEETDTNPRGVWTLTAVEAA